MRLDNLPNSTGIGRPPHRARIRGLVEGDEDIVDLVRFKVGVENARTRLDQLRIVHHPLKAAFVCSNSLEISRFLTKAIFSLASLTYIFF